MKTKFLKFASLILNVGLSVCLASTALLSTNARAEDVPMCGKLIALEFGPHPESSSVSIMKLVFEGDVNGSKTFLLPTQANEVYAAQCNRMTALAQLASVNQYELCAAGSSYRDQCIEFSIEVKR